MKPLLVTSGEPSGIGPDLCLALAGLEYPLVVLCDKSVLAARAQQLGLDIVLEDYDPVKPIHSAPSHLTVLSLPCAAPVYAGQLNTQNAADVLNRLEVAASACMEGRFSALVTAPVHKAIINEAGFAFTGHTEFFADQCHAEQVVMMLAGDTLKMALVTTHLPLKDVPNAITVSLINAVISKLSCALQRDFGITHPKIKVAGLNPHAGESGYLGLEEIEVITPALTLLQQRGIDVTGPYSADTLFTPQAANTCDAFVAMYHDQGLPVLKYASFGRAVNITLGLPIIRTSVDHGTALELAGKGMADPGSLLAAVKMAAMMAMQREQQNAPS